MLTRCCLRKRNSRCAILFWSRRAACELRGTSDDARKQVDSASLGVFLSPRFTGRGILMFVGRLKVGLEKKPNRECERKILGRVSQKPKGHSHQSRQQKGCALWYVVLNLTLDRGRERRRSSRTVVGYDIFLCRRADVTSVDPARIRRRHISLRLPRPDHIPSNQSTVLQIEPLWQTVGNQHSVPERDPDLLRFVLFLYMMRCPHSRQRMGSRGLMSFFAPQSSIQLTHDSIRDGHVSHQHTDTPSPVSEGAKGARWQQSQAVLDSSWLFLNKPLVTVVTRLLAWSRSRCDGIQAPWHPRCAPQHLIQTAGAFCPTVIVLHQNPVPVPLYLSLFVPRRPSFHKWTFGGGLSLGPPKAPEKNKKDLEQNANGTVQLSPCRPR